jgi:hypothetical protein
MPLGIKRWWSAQAQAQTQARSHPACWQAAAWARAQGHVFRSVLAEGFVVEGQLNEPFRANDPTRRSAPAPTAKVVPWRMEWGPSKRHYITQQELRLRSEPVFDTGLQLLVINRCLKDHMERSVFELFVEGVQTRIDTATPPEMRWLVLLPTVPSMEVPGLGQEWVAVASHKAALVQWVSEALGAALATLVRDPLQPVVLMITQGYLSVRTELAEEDLEALQGWCGLFETALKAALQIGALAAPQSQPAAALTGLEAAATA